MNSENPFEGPVPDGGDPPYEWIDEWLCEYVDGTMDPSLEAVFEQYVEANPELEAHIKRLQQTRDLLCECGRSRAASPDVEPAPRMDEGPASPPASPSVSDAVRNRPVVAAGMVSSIALAFVVGLLVGATMMRPAPPVSSTAPSVDRVTRSAPLPQRLQPAVRDDRSLRPRAAPFAASDSTERPSSLTTIGLP
ncbi:MAG: anti-sigma factor [Salinibacter sp.]